MLYHGSDYTKIQQKASICSLKELCYIVPMRKHFKKAKSYILSYKKISAAIFILAIVGGYFGYKKFTDTSGETRFVTAKATIGTVTASISGTGQVSALNQIDVKTKVSGTVVSVWRKNGDVVATGTILAALDTTEAQKSVRDAEINLESVKIAFSKLKIQTAPENLKNNLTKAYDEGFNTVSDVFLDILGIMSGLNDMFFKTSSMSGGQWNIDWYEAQVASVNNERVKIYKKSFYDSYAATRQSYEESLEKYKSVSRTSEDTLIGNLIEQTYDTTKLIADATKNANDYIDFVKGSMENADFAIPVIITTHKNLLNGYTTKTNSHLSALLGSKNSIKGYSDAFPNALLDAQSSELTIRQGENALLDAQNKLKDYYIRAPFDGTVTSIKIKRAEEISAGGMVATLITRKQLAEISMNEVDAAKTKIGQKAKLTFDAIPKLTIVGEVTEIDSIGTVAQGVVTYNVKVGFDNQDDRIKPGMSVSAEVTSESKENVLVVPNSAVKTAAGKNYVEMLREDNKSNRVPVEIGLTGDSQTEIISGIKEGDEIITRTIASAVATASSNAPSIFGGNQRGGAVRVQTR